MSLNRNELANGFYFIGLLVLVTGLPLSMFLMSLGQLILFLGWILSGKLLQKLKLFCTNPVTIAIGSVYILHLIGFIWSSDIDYALKDARIKFPLLLLPLIIYTSPPLSREKFYQVLYVFIGATIVSSFASMAVLAGFTSHQVNDIRDISIFISHIRFGLLIDIAIFSCCLIWFRERKNQATWKNIMLLAAAAWLIVFLVILEAMTGLVVLLIVSLITGIVLTSRHPNKLVKSFFLIPLLLSAGLFYHVIEISKEINISTRTDYSMLENESPRGHPYLHDSPKDDTENGNPIWVYICPAEIDSVWPLKSNMSIKGNDHKGQLLFYTLIRYMTSKGLRKDADGIGSLTQDDVKAIEAGNTDYRFTGTSNLNARIYQIVWEYHHYMKHGIAQGHSVMQRLEFWKTGWNIFKEYPLLGVGTGDVQSAFDAQYTKQDSKLKNEWRLRAHNQFLTFALTFGAGGLVVFLFSLAFPYFKLAKNNDVLYSLFIFTALLSFLNEDTLETQAGVTFFAFFNAFFLFGKSEK